MELERKESLRQEAENEFVYSIALLIQRLPHLNRQKWLIDKCIVSIGVPVSHPESFNILSKVLSMLQRWGEPTYFDLDQFLEELNNQVEKAVYNTSDNSDKQI